MNERKERADQQWSNRGELRDELSSKCCFGLQATYLLSSPPMKSSWTYLSGGKLCSKTEVTRIVRETAFKRIRRHRGM